MKIEIELPISDLKRALAGLGKVMGRTGLPALRCIRMARDESHRVTLSVTDLNSFATYRVMEPQPGEPVTILVPWELFVKVAKGTKDRAIFIREKADQVAARYFVGSMSFEEPAAMPPLDEWPTLPEISGPIQDLGVSFKSALVEGMSCASTDPSRFVLHGVCLDVTRPDGHYMVATDARQLYSANSFKFDLPRSIIIPTRKFLTWSGFVEDGDWKLRTKLEPEEKDGGWVEISSERWTLQTMLIGEHYPNWRPIFPVETTTLATVQLNPEAVQTLLDAVPSVHTRQPNHDPACLSTDGNRLFLCGRSTQDGPWIELLIPGAHVIGPATTVLLNKEQLLSALRMGFGEMELRDALTTVVLRGPGKQMALGVVRGEMPQPLVENSAPSAAQPIPSTTANERNSMNTNTTSDRTKTTTATPEPETPIRAAMAQVEVVRNAYRESLNGLNQAMTLLKSAERDQKSSEKEIDSVRSTLRSLQRVQI